MLLNIDVTEQTLPMVLERSRDVDVNVRRFLYRKKLCDLDWRFLSVEQRQDLLLTGLNDRDEGVQKACLHLIFSNWISRVENNLVYLLSCLDVVSNVKLGEALLKGYFEVSPNAVHPFDDPEYWLNLTPETALYLRAYCDTCRERSEFSAQEYLPELTDFTEYLQRYSNMYLGTQDEAEKLGREFILLQLLLTAKVLDFSDEVGRRFLFTQISTTRPRPEGKYSSIWQRI